MIFETGISALDQFSIGHVVMGAIIFLLLLMILGSFGKKRDLFIVLISFILTIVISVGWEVLENSQFYIDSGLKYNNMKDSTINMFMDIALDITGAFIVFIIFWYIFKKTNVKQDLEQFKKKIIK